MGSKDKGKREQKKSKKDGKKTVAPTIFEPVAEVQLIKKKEQERRIPRIEHTVTGQNPAGSRTVTKNKCLSLRTSKL